jgi:hypothetical protein
MQTGTARVSGPVLPATNCIVDRVARTSRRGPKVDCQILEMRARTTTAGQGARRAVTAKAMVEAKLRPDGEVYIMKFRNPPESCAGFVTFQNRTVTKTPCRHGATWRRTRGLTMVGRQNPP